MRVFRSAWQSICQNRLRSFLAGFGIAWGIFLLVVFLGIGNGFKEGVMKLFDGFAQKSLFVYGGQVQFQSSIVEEVRNRYGLITACSPEMIASSVTVKADNETCVATVKGVGTDYFRIRIIEPKEGRQFSLLEEKLMCNVALIGEGVAQTLFKDKSGVGGMIVIGDALFNVIGVLPSDDLFSMQERNAIYVPAETFCNCFQAGGMIPSFCLSLASRANAIAIEKDLRGFLASRYGFDEKEDRFVYITNIESQTKSFSGLFHGLEVMIWLVGICLLLSGIVGVGNVMLIIVKERTSEIGIRKAVGATASSVITMILAESVLLTTISGIAGTIAGGAILILADKVLLSRLDMALMGNLSFDGATILTALCILCFCGVAAGLFPALKASRIAPIDAIRYENRE